MAWNAAKLRDLGPEELAKEANDLRDQIWKLRLQKATGQAQDPDRVRSARRDLARVLTVIRERELARERGGAK